MEMSGSPTFLRYWDIIDIRCFCSPRCPSSFHIFISVEFHIIERRDWHRGHLKYTCNPLLNDEVHTQCGASGITTNTLVLLHCEDASYKRKG